MPTHRARDSSKRLDSLVGTLMDKQDKQNAGTPCKQAIQKQLLLQRKEIHLVWNEVNILKQNIRGVPRYLTIGCMTHTGEI